MYSSPPSADNLLKIAHSLNTSCEFLLTGIEQKYRCSEFESEVLSLFRSLPHDAQLEFRGELKGYIKCLKQQEEDTVKPLKKANNKLRVVPEQKGEITMKRENVSFGE